MRKYFVALSEVSHELSAIEVTIVHSTKLEKTSLSLRTGFHTRLEKTSPSIQSLPNESQNFAAYTKLTCFLIGDHALIGGEDCSTETAKNLRQVLLVSVYTQTRFGNSLDTGNNLFVLIFAVL